MTEGAYRRLTRYAAFSLLQLLVVVAVVAGAVDAGIAGLVVLAASAPLVWAWGLYHADVAMNPLLDEAGRTRWRLAIWFVPGTIALYWQRHVRGRRAD